MILGTNCTNITTFNGTLCMGNLMRSIGHPSRVRMPVCTRVNAHQDISYSACLIEHKIKPKIVSNSFPN